MMLNYLVPTVVLYFIFSAAIVCAQGPVGTGSSTDGAHADASKGHNKQCIADKLRTRSTRDFSLPGRARCPGGGCLFRSSRCNRRETNLSYSVPSGYVVDEYKFEPGDMNDGDWDFRQPNRNQLGQIVSISVKLICDPPDFPGAGGGWSTGKLSGTVRHADITTLIHEIKEECENDVEAAD